MLRHRLSPKMLYTAMNFWPPFAGAGIRVSYDPRNQSVTCTMKLSWYNRNYMGTHFGGSLASMADPFFMLLLIGRLGRGYRVWDSASTITFIKPGKGKVGVTFAIEEERVDEIRRQADSGEKIFPQFSAMIRNESGEDVARIDKTLYVRKVTDAG